MSERIDAIFENGAFWPEVPVSIPDGERVSLDVKVQATRADDLSDVNDLLDVEFMESCRQHAKLVPSLEELRRALSAFEGSVADRISQERDER